MPTMPTMPKIDFSKFELPKIDLTKFELPKIDFSKFELPKVDLTKFELPKIDLAKVELPKVDTAAIAEFDDKVVALVRDAAYVTVGLGVLAVQQAQRNVAAVRGQLRRYAK